MIRLGQREFPIPLWLWAALPFAAILYALFDYVTFVFSFKSFYPGDADRNFLSLMTRLGTAYLTAFLLVDIVRRSRTPWYAVPLIYLVSAGAATLTVTDIITRPFGNVAQFVAGALIMIAASTKAAGGGAITLLLVTAIVPIVLAVGAALFVTIASRIPAALPLRTRDTWREFWVNLAGAAIWMTIAIGGYLALRNGGISAAPRWAICAAAGLGAAAATAAHLWLVRRSQRDEAHEGHIRVWLMAILCVVSFVYRPDVFGLATMHAYYDRVRPALRAVHLLPTPELVVGGYKVDVVFHDFKVMRGEPHPAGGVSFVIAPFPEEYGLEPGKRPARIYIFRRDARVSYNVPVWDQRRKALETAQTQTPGRDAMLHYPGVDPAVSLRTDAFPELEFQLSSFDPAAPPEAVEAALRRFLQERVRRQG